MEKNKKLSLRTTLCVATVVQLWVDKPKTARNAMELSSLFWKNLHTVSAPYGVGPYIEQINEGKAFRSKGPLA